jgi:Cof subfamily protein (haloacid dehalogenase superfamily)
VSEHPSIKLILSDIDGTILPFGQRVVSQRVIDSFHAALRTGIHVGPASGRGISHVVPSFGGDEACVATALGTNGMQVYLDGELIHEEYLDHDELVNIADVVREVPGAGAICFGGPQVNEVYLVAGTVEDLAPVFPAYASKAKPADAVPDFPIVKSNVFINGDMAATRDLIALLREKVPGIGFNVPMAGFLNVVPLGYSKATGIDYLCEAMGITTDEVMVFGDGGNDLEMIEHVPNSVAVSNAAPEVLAAARYHIGACADEAVADVMLALAADTDPFAE